MLELRIMPSRTPVEIADRISRRRAWLIVLGASVFVFAQALSAPPFRSVADQGLYRSRALMWMLNVIALLALLATGGGLLNSAQIRALVNDEVSRMNYHTSAIIGFWTAMIVGLVLYVIPPVSNFSGQQAIYLVVTAAVFISSVAFAALELRAHRDE
jgi:hypothetical protein